MLTTLHQRTQCEYRLLQGLMRGERSAGNKNCNPFLKHFQYCWLSAHLINSMTSKKCQINLHFFVQIFTPNLELTKGFENLVGQSFPMSDAIWQRGNTHPVVWTTCYTSAERSTGRHCSHLHKIGGKLYARTILRTAGLFLDYSDVRRNKWTLSTSDRSNRARSNDCALHFIFVFCQSNSQGATLLMRRR